MGKYQDDVQALLRLVGGKENIQAVSHCMTRMRFVLADPAKAEVKQIERLASVKGTFTQAGQFQVIIGNDVANFTMNSPLSPALRASARTLSRRRPRQISR